ncbi:glycosyltransferase family 4 protein [Vibrio crassostreae]|uniref:glycosyltransferase family 4 protein n=1 Tax=Vibrio crassostreae TaxID=246167 RepID=UPI001B30D414|nr:glycosyltransferase family 4 protein [Vibrio crassostreae]
MNSKSKKNLLYVFGGILPSQAASSLHVAKFCKALQKEFNVTLIGRQDKAKSFEDVYNFSPSYKLILSNLPNVRRCEILLFVMSIFSKSWRDADFIYTRDIMVAYLSVILGKKFIYEHHNIGWSEHRLSKWMLSKVIDSKFLMKNIVITDSLKKDSMEILKIPDDIIEVLPDAADKPVESATYKYLQGNFEKNIGYVGSLYTGKGVELVIEIANVMPHLAFHIVGGDSNQIDHLKVHSPGNVYYYGFKYQSDVEKMINSFDVCLLPNQVRVVGAGKYSGSIDIGRYTSPLKLFQYMAHNRKIVCSDLDVIKEVVSSRQVWLANCTDPEDWKCKINEALNQLDSDKENLAYELFLSKFTWSVRAKKIHEISRVYDSNRLT